MAAALETVGLVSGALGIIQFFMDNLPGSAGPQGTAVNIKAGLSQIGDDVDNLGGTIAAVYGFNTFNEYIGQSDSKHINEADYVTFTIDQSSPGEQADYISVANNGDATCISWISTEPSDSSKGGAWTGDIGAECGQRWHMGNQRAGDLPNNGGEYVPKCTWLDADFTDGTVSASLKFPIKAYGEKAEDTVAKSNQCGSTIFGKDNGPIAGQPATKRSAPPARPQWIIDRLVMSNITNQNAEELCSSETSWGPDFCGVDGKCCDMDTKTLFPLCEFEDVDGCVEVDANAKTMVKRSSVARRTVEKVHKSYKTVTHNS
ncbi:hypothetical protein HII31_03510 [Pseudocercospora fuligena]|uniref:Uncharacterized protein n=1 Tax=Pseudocercospora fuligena TaxID=685502 RepID=A0A8H6RQF5_9PEZI|nr:hypothetical protein HII31_03510 [Pseudocercospora fuligena]